MIKLIVVLCSLAHPSECIELLQEPEDGHSVTAFECGAGAEQIAQPALETHPGYFLKGWRCRLGGANG
jgi:hypothetical protein